jgi:hypothetical protein
MSTAVTQYRAGETFACIKHEFDPTQPNGVAAEPCGAEIVMHGYHWCAQVCPRCLAIYHDTRGEIRTDFGAFWDATTRQAIVANIASNGGQYIPTF